MKTFQQFNLKALTPILFFMLVIALFNSCKKNDEASPDVAGINVINAVPGSPGVNFSLNGALVSGPVLAYPLSSGYFSAYAGAQKIDFSNNGSTTSIATTTTSLAPNGYYSIYLVGSTTSSSVMITEDNPAPPAAGKAKIRFINVSPDAPAFNLVTSTGTVLFSNVGYKTSSDYATIDPMTYTLQVKNATGSNVLVSSDKIIQSGVIYTVMVSGLVAGSGTTALSLSSFTGF